MVFLNHVLEQLGTRPLTVTSQVRTHILGKRDKENCAHGGFLSRLVLDFVVAEYGDVFDGRGQLEKLSHISSARSQSHQLMLLCSRNKGLGSIFFISTRRKLKKVGRCDPFALKIRASPSLSIFID
ncbi:hypothetical protein ACJX0J_039698, partial [Zea mays]